MKSLIGTKWYPTDNSFCICIDDPSFNLHDSVKYKFLAGTNEYHAVQVEIVSEPFNMQVDASDWKTILPFVIVKYNEKKYIMLFDHKSLEYQLTEEWLMSKIVKSLL